MNYLFRRKVKLSVYILEEVFFSSAAHHFLISGIISAQTSFFPHLSSLSLSHCHSEQIRLFQHSKFREPEKRSIEGMIESNKKWLEGFKKDSKVYLLPGSHL